MNYRTLKPESKRQSGVALVVGLLLLVVMTLIGITTMRGTILEERMAGNYRDKGLSFQMAETALRDAELEIKGCASCGRKISGLTGFASSCDSTGLCYDTDSSFDPVATLEGGHGVAYGTYTSAPSVPSSISSAPRYVIEGYKVRPPGAASWKYMYRITAIGFGGSDNSRTFLQSAYKP